MRIVSIHTGHDSNACVYNDGKVEKYILTERVTGKKHDRDIYSILPEFLSSLPEEVDYFLISADQKVRDLILEHYPYDFGNWDVWPKDEFRRKNENIISANEHHRYHAELAYWNSGFDKSIVVVVDSQGQHVNKFNDLVESESIYVYDGLKRPKRLYKSVIREISESNFTSRKFEKLVTQYSHKNNFGLGSFYDIAAKYIGGDCDEVMSLAAYGESTSKYKFFLKGNCFNNEGAFEHYDDDRATEITNENHKKYADFCYETQRQTEKALGDLVASSVATTGIKKVCVSGGYAMNVYANYYLTQRFPDVEFYFEPMCGNSGLSIGYAMSHYFLEHIDFPDCPCGGIPEPLETTFLHGEVYENNYVGDKKNVKDIAKLLHGNKSVGVYGGLAESGQYALGNRSILFNALNRDAKKIVNKIKNEEWYKSFSVVTLEEDAHRFFDNVTPSAMCFPSNKGLGLLLSGVTHVDGTCVVQVVHSGHLYELLKEFKEISGYGILLNTSLNLAGDPFVETPEQAVSLLKNSSLDHLWFADTGQML
jgi:carbamoyltransferase